MPVSKPMSVLRESAQEISRICHDSGEPVFLTMDGKKDLVVMSLDAYERSQARLELYRLLDEAEDDFRKGDRGISVEAMRERLTA